MSAQPKVFYRIQQLAEPVIVPPSADEIDTWGELEAPKGWAEYCVEMGWEPSTEFFLPSINKTYRTREAAENRAALVNRWGGNVEVVATFTRWRPLPDHDEIAVQQEAKLALIELDKKRTALMQIIYPGDVPF